MCKVYTKQNIQVLNIIDDTRCLRFSYGCDGSGYGCCGGHHSTNIIPNSKVPALYNYTHISLYKIHV